MLWRGPSILQSLNSVAVTRAGRLAFPNRGGIAIVKRTFLFLPLAAVLAASLAFAQTSGAMSNPANRVQRRVGFLTNVLGLTSAQQQQATTIYTNAADAEASIQSSLKAARQTLQTAVTNNDTGGIEQNATTIGTLTGQLLSAQSKADAAFYQILTPDQQAKWTQFHSQQRQRGWGGGMRGRMRSN
jgi:Spy/CpxP family protein refolding chaperone